MGYTAVDFYKDVESSIKKITGSTPTTEECKAVAHHMEYNIRGDRHHADNGHRRLTIDNLRWKIVEQIRKNFHANDMPRYVAQYRRYKDYQKNRELTAGEKKDLESIAKGQKKVSDFQDKDYLTNLYIKYFNQALLPDIRQISWQEKNHLKYHGIWHTEQVALFAIDISIKENMNPLPNLLAAALHDCARKSDDGDKEHAQNCEPIARDYLDNLYEDRHLLTQRDKQQIIHAVTHHNAPSKDKSNEVLNCLQDADSMRLWWEKTATYLANTPTGAKMAQYNWWEQIKYMAGMLERMRATTLPYQGGNGLSKFFGGNGR